MGIERALGASRSRFTQSEDQSIVPIERIAPGIWISPPCLADL